MTVMAGKFPWNVERWREPARAQLAQRAGAAEPIRARHARNWSDREDFQGDITVPVITPAALNRIKPLKNSGVLAGAQRLLSHLEGEAYTQSSTQNR